MSSSSSDVRPESSSGRSGRPAGHIRESADRFAERWPSSFAVRHREHGETCATERCPEDFDPIWVFSQFNLAAIALYRRDWNLLPTAERHLRNALEGVKSARGRAGSAEDEFRTALALCLRMQGNIDVADDEIKQVNLERVLPGSVLYNLACYHCSTSADDAEMEKALRYLKEAQEALPSMLEWAKTDPSLQPLREYEERRKQPGK